MRCGDDTPWLHIRSQFTYHFEATIKGTKTGLAALRDAIDCALERGSGAATAYASDGEGYEVAVTRSRTVSGIGNPTYLDEEARNLARYEREYMTRHTRAERRQSQEALTALRWCRANGNPHLPKDTSDDA